MATNETRRTEEDMVARTRELDKAATLGPWRV